MTNEPKRVALVTGGGGGLGAAIAIHLAQRGFDVAVHYHTSEESALATRKQCLASGGRAESFQSDLTDEAGALRLRAAFDERFDRLDVLVNNAGAYHQKGFYELTEDEWFLELNSTASAAYFTTRTFVDLLRASRGRVVNVGDGSCDRPGARDLAPGYHVGKTGVWLLTRSFAKHEARHGVTVNMISPGLLETSVGLGSPDVVPAGRFGVHADVLEAIDMLFAVDAPYVTGSNIVVSGGWNL